MRPVRVKWGKLSLEVPVEILLFLLFKVFPVALLERLTFATAPDSKFREPPGGNLVIARSCNQAMFARREVNIIPARRRYGGA